MPELTAADYLHAYDTQLRTEVETQGEVSSETWGPLRLVRFPGGSGFVTHPRMDESDPVVVRGLVAHAAEHFAADPSITVVEWKVRAHDHLAGLEDALGEHGFVAGEVEAILVGPLQGLVRGEAPPGVTVRQVTTPDDIRSMSGMIDEAFGEDYNAERAESLIARVANGEPMQLWVAEVDGRMVSGGRIEPVPGTDFVGFWGGATLHDYRGRGIYGAVTTARARSALAMGKTLVHSDSSADSQPILKRAGMVQVSTTTPWEWTRPWAEVGG